MNLTFKSSEKKTLRYNSETARLFLINKKKFHADIAHLWYIFIERKILQPFPTRDLFIFHIYIEAVNYPPTLTSIRLTCTS